MSNPTEPEFVQAPKIKLSLNLSRKTLISKPEISAPHGLLVNTENSPFDDIPPQNIQPTPTLDYTATSNAPSSIPRVKLRLKLPQNLNDKYQSTPISTEKVQKLPQPEEDEIVNVLSEDDSPSVYNSSVVAEEEIGGNSGENQFSLNFSSSRATSPAPQNRQSSISRAASTISNSSSTTATRIATPSNTWHRRKKKQKSIYSVLDNLLNSFVRKDEYGFFLEPVNTRVVTDYLSVVSQPMDFSRIRSKIKRRKYHKFEEFSCDLMLITANAKIYNRPDTIYHKAADKLEQIMRKTLDKITSSTRFEEDEIDQESVVSKTESVKPFIRSAFEGKTHETTPQSSKKVSKKRKIITYAPDGSVEPDSMEDLIPFFILPKLEFPFDRASKTLSSLFDEDSQDVNIPTAYLDYGPYNTLPLSFNNVTTIPEQKEISKDEYTSANCYHGDISSFAYVSSLKEFTKDFESIPELHRAVVARMKPILGDTQNKNKFL